MNDSKDLNSIFERTVQDQNFVKAGHPEYAKASEAPAAELRAPPHLRLGRKKCKGVVCRDKEPVAEFPGALLSRSRKLGLGGLDDPSAGRRNGSRSTCPGALKPFVEIPVKLFPESWADFNCRSGV